MTWRLGGGMAGTDLEPWLESKLSDPDGWDAVVGRVTEAIDGRDPVGVPGPGGGVSASLRATVLRARFAFLTESAPPYSALHGAHIAGLADLDTVHAVAARFPTHATLDPQRRARALDWRPTRRGWIDVTDPRSYPAHAARLPPTTPPPDPAHAPGTGPYRELLAELGDRSAALVTGPAAPGHVADPATERVLAATCAIFAGWEHAHHLGSLPGGTHSRTTGYRPPPPLAPGVETVDDLLATADPATVDDVAALAELARDSGALDEFARLAGDPPSRPDPRWHRAGLGTASPTMVPGWAAGDLLLGRDPRRPATLLDVVIADRLPHEAGLVASWRRLLALAWLDVREHHHVGRVGLYFARHAATITWDTRELAAALAGLDPDDTGGLHALRREFLRRARPTVHHTGHDTRWLRLPHDCPPTPPNRPQRR